MFDSFGRKVNYVRISVTDRCDLRCKYCMPQKMKFTQKEDSLSVKEMKIISNIFFDLGFKKIRITGGEPLIRKDIIDFLSFLNSKLNFWGIKNFDLSIYDRVLYLLSEIEIRSHFEEYNEFMKYLIIDDFHNSNKTEKNMAYFSKNYEKILLDFGFKLIENEPSCHISGNDDFFKRNARRLIFEKE